MEKGLKFKAVVQLLTVLSVLCLIACAGEEESNSDSEDESGDKTTGGGEGDDDNDAVTDDDDNDDTIPSDDNDGALSDDDDSGDDGGYVIGDDDDDNAGDDDDEGNDDDDFISSDDDDNDIVSSGELKIIKVTPDSGGATVDTKVTITGEGFGAGLVVFVGNAQALSVSAISSTTAEATFPSIPLTERGAKDVRVVFNGKEATLAGGFIYFFDEDPIVFVHGWGRSGKDYETMLQRFKALGYPDDYLAAISYKNSYGSNFTHARDELAPFVDAVLQRTGAKRVDIVAHSMGGMSSRLYVKQYGGCEKVRSYISLASTHHGNDAGCYFPSELCPAYADKSNELQWTLNGDPTSDDVDETPCGVEEGGGVHWRALIADADFIVNPKESGCLDQKFKNDCSAPINEIVKGVSHMDMITNEGIFEKVRDHLRQNNVSKP